MSFFLASIFFVFSFSWYKERCLIVFAFPKLLAALTVGETKFVLSDRILEEHGVVRPLPGDVSLDLGEETAELGEDGDMSL